MPTLRTGVIGALALGTAATLGLPAVATPAGAAPSAATPIQHVVVIFQENVSYDHYFATYPQAANTDGTSWDNSATAPANDNLVSAGLISANPNSALPQRLDSTPTGNNGGAPGGQLTCDMDHNYSDEQTAFDGGQMNLFVQSVGTATGTAPGTTNACQASVVMDYYDGNTVTGMWNYAQHYAMSDNSYNSTFGPSAPGAINLISGDTGGIDTTHEADSPSIATASKPNADLTPDGSGGYSLTSDAQPYWDDCSTRDAVALTGSNIGDQLNAAGLSWGWFQGGLRPTTSYATASGGAATSTFTPDEFSGKEPLPPHASNQGLCNAVHPIGVALGGTGQYGYKDDYIAHHEPFDYYVSTANPHHLTLNTDAGGNDLLTGPDSLSTLGTDTQTFSGGYGVGPQFDTPNHNYDISDFDQLVSAIAHGQLPASALPAVSFLKAPGYEDGHAAYSDPADEQQFVTREINALMQTSDWSSTAVFINYDDSDGWYDHAFATGNASPSVLTPLNPSSSVADNLFNTQPKGSPASGSCVAPGQSGSSALEGQQGRCGLGPRIPMLLVSPWARSNYIDHAVSDNSSIVRFIEGNWGLGNITGSFADLSYNLSASQPALAPLGPLSNLFDFSNPSSPPDAGAFFLDPTTGQPTSTPVPVLPESRTPVLLLTAAALLVGGWVIRRGRRVHGNAA